MSSEETEAIVIRMADFSESSRVVTFFSRDFGKISAVAKGAKRPKSPFEAALDLLSVCNIVFIRKGSGGLDILTETQLKTRFRTQDRDLSGLYGGYYVAELLAGLSEEHDPHPDLYQAALEALETLATGGNVPIAVLRFELIVLREIGQLPTFDLCVRCGEPAQDAPWHGVKASLGGLVCPACLQNEKYYHRLSAGSVLVMKRLSAHTDSWRCLVLTLQQITEIRPIVDSTIRQAMGRRPKTLGFLNFR